MEHNTACLISLLASHIGQNKLPTLKHIDWEQLYTLGKIHSVSGMIYLSLQAQQHEVELPDTVRDKLKQDFISTLSRAAAQELEMKHVIELFNQEQINHLLFKGFALKDMYPVPEMRTMGDIDILIHASNRQKSHVLLEGAGFKATTTGGNVWTYIKGSVRLEIHDHLISRNLNNQIDLRDYYKNAWKYAVNISPQGNTYQFTKNDHFVYLLVHMAKHFYSTGCGIRMFLDIAVFIQRYGNQLDWSYIISECSMLKLDVFANHVLELCVRWFNVTVPITIPKMDELFYEQISEYICSAGVFGYYERNQYIGILRMAGAKKPTGREGKLWMISMYWSICFPSYETMSRTATYSFLKNKPMLLPVAWGIRAARSLLFRWKSTWALLTGVMGGEQEFDRQGKLLEKLGL